MKCSRFYCTFEAVSKGLCSTHWLSKFNAIQEARQYWGPTEIEEHKRDMEDAITEDDHVTESMDNRTDKPGGVRS